MELEGENKVREDLERNEIARPSGQFRLSFWAEPLFGEEKGQRPLGPHRAASAAATRCVRERYPLWAETRKRLGALAHSTRFRAFARRHARMRTLWLMPSANSIFRCSKLAVQPSGPTMTKHDPIRIQILATNDEAGAAGEAIAVAQAKRQQIAAIGEGQGAEALLVCPAPEGYVNDGFSLVVFARFPAGFDEDTVFWRQRQLGQELFSKLRLSATVSDLDAPQGYVSQIH